MSVDLREISCKYMHLNLLHRYTSQVCSAGFGIHRGQPPILEYLEKHGESSQKDIASFLSVSPASVAVSIKRLQKSGFVEKTPDEHDLRFNKVRLTEPGKEANMRVKLKFDGRDKKMFKGFSQDELLIFSDYLDRMIDNLTPEKGISVGEMIDYIHKKEENDV